MQLIKSYWTNASLSFHIFKPKQKSLLIVLKYFKWTLKKKKKTLNNQKYLTKNIFLLRGPYLHVCEPQSFIFAGHSLLTSVLMRLT